MKVAQINGGVFGSTAKIMFGIADLAEKENIETKCFSPVTVTNQNNEPNWEYTKIGNFRGRQLSVLLSRITGYEGCFALFSTYKLIKQLKAFGPDIIHIHNIHNSYLNLSQLFKYIKKSKVKVIWTLHDCWSFTGHCPHFTINKCDKWKTGCYGCERYKEYPVSYFDNSKKMYKLKKKWFTGIDNLTVVTPSKWLADLAKQSFLKDYPVKVINNGIDLSVFEPCESDFRKKYGLENKFVLLGVAFGWGKRKGLDVFIELAKKLDKEKHQIVLVGTNEQTDKLLPENIISIHRTNNQSELAQIYSAADLFVNTTREDTYPTVNMEALACGTPVLTFKTGGSPEIPDEHSGSVVDCDDIEALENEIIRIADEKPFSKEDCLSRASEFSAQSKFSQYIELYKEK